MVKLCAMLQLYTIQMQTIVAVYLFLQTLLARTQISKVITYLSIIIVRSILLGQSQVYALPLSYTYISVCGRTTLVIVILMADSCGYLFGFLLYI